jgi:hypothetical protein
MGHLNPESEPPVHCRHLIEWFWDLSTARSHGFDGPNPLSLSDIANWSALTGNIIRRDEITILRAMDGAYLDAVSAEMADRQEREKAKREKSRAR